VDRAGPAVADVVGPAVAAEDPDGFFREDVGIDLDGGLGRIGVGQQRLHLVAVLPGEGGVVLARQPAGQGGAQLVGKRTFQGGGHLVGQLGPALVDGQIVAEAEFGRVLEQRIVPGRSVSLGIDGVGRGRRGAAPDGRTARGVGHHHPLAEELG